MFNKSILLLLTALSVFSVSAASSTLINRTVRYDNHMLLQVARTPQVIKVAQRLDLDIWGKSTRWLEIRVSPDQYRQFLKTIPHNTPTQVLNMNIQKDIDAETTALQAQLTKPRTVAVGPEWHTAYHTYSDIVAWMNELATKYSNVVKVDASIGKSHQGKDIPMFRITGTGGDQASKKRVWVQGMQHAREWISGATMQYLADSLASGYGSNPRVKTLLDQVEFLIVPVANPDGYAYSWTTDRMWRKNRAVNKGSSAIGVDMNRNWSDHWGQGGSSSSPSSDTYMGPSPASEPEVKALMAAFKNAPNVVASYDIHSFSQLILRPYGWTETQRAPDEAALTKLGEVLKTEIAKSRRTSYTNQRVVDLYVASGGSNDWWYGIGTDKGKPKVYGMAMELPPNSPFSGGFVLDPKNIKPIGEEIFAAMVAGTEFVLANPLPVQQ